MERPTLSGKSNYRVEAVLDVSKNDTRVFGDGTYSDAISNKATGTASIADENTYHVQADSESVEYVSAFARQSQGIITVSAQSGFQPQPDDGAGTVKEEDVKKTPIQAQRQVRERMVTKIEPVQTLTSSSKAIPTKNKFAAIAAVDGEVVDDKEQSRKTPDGKVKKRWLREIEAANRLTSSSKPTSAVDGKEVVDINDKESRKKTQHRHVKEHLTTKIDQTKSLASSPKLISTKNKFAVADEVIEQEQLDQGTIVQGVTNEENDTDDEEAEISIHWCDIL